MRRRSRIDQKILDGFLTRETSFLMAEEVKALVGTMRISVEQLIEQLLPWAAEKALAPVSKFKVGAVCRGNSGNLFIGANMEFAGLPMHTTVHAEQASLANAMAHGETGVKALAVTAQPCGLCRQFLNELNTASELKIQVGSNQSLLLPELLPHHFGPKDLDIQHHLFDPQSNDLSLEKPSDDKLVNTALETANQSYAPYSSAFAGVAIQTRNAQVFKGHYLENAAFNPSLLPLQACLSNLVMAGRNFGEIVDVVLVHHKKGSVSHVSDAQELLQTITPVPLKAYNAV